jgi:putative oxidoreductase
MSSMSPTTSSPLKRLSSLGLRITSPLAFLAPFTTRLVLGVGFYYHGSGKLGNLGQVTSFFSDLGIPLPAANAHFIGTLELVGGICLVLGLGTRIFAALLSCTMIVALLIADGGDWLKKFPADITDVTSFTYLLFLTWLVFYGPGPFSLDRLLTNWLRSDARLVESSPANS